MDNWLNNAVVYEIYPQSFYDSNGDGIGDIPGILKKLDYIHSCGFTAIWLNPINKSSFRDAGYDVTDFYSVDPRYGSNEDYRALCDAAHSLGMKVIFDLVAGHTSIDHPWFRQSGKIEKNRYTNRYIWTVSTFDAGPGIGGLGERDAKCIENFFWSQPALNYGYAHPDPRHPWELPVTHPDCLAMKEELKKIICFWMDLGTDAFRVDMAASLIKGDVDGSFTNAFWREIRGFMEERNPQCLLIAEWGEPCKAVKAGFHLDFLLHSELSSAYTSLFRHEEGRNTTKAHIGHSYFHKDGKGNINEYLDRYLYDLAEIGDQGAVGMITGNHDMQRLAYGRTPAEIKCALVFLFTMKGVPFVYYGDEIGMDFIPNLPSKEGGYIRTGSRTPMQWDATKNAGFSDSDTIYLPTDSRPGAPTVAEQEKNPDSLLCFVRELIRLHKSLPMLWADGKLEILHAGYPFVFSREKDGQRLLIALNPSAYPVRFSCGPLREVLIQQNAAQTDGELLLDGVSFLVGRV